MTDTKERPILFSSPMVRSILNGSKSQTRRVVKLTDSGRVKETGSPRNWHLDDPNAALACPYGQPGDRLWVRETWQGPLLEEFETDADADWYRPDRIHQYQNPAHCAYAADGGAAPEFIDLDDERQQRWRPSIHMPRWASRITLEVTGVRVERLRGISEADAKAEGIERGDGFPGWYRGTLAGDSAELQKLGTRFKIPTAFPRLAYQALWESINGPGSWDANPWVWVVEFKRLPEDHK